MSERRLIIKSILKFLVIGTVYYIFIRLTGIAIPCVVRLITRGKLLCPGCGVTNLCLNILKGDFYNAFLSNPCIFIFGILWAVIIVIKLTVQPEWLKNGSRIFKIAEYVTLAALLAFGIVRNIMRLT